MRISDWSSDVCSSDLFHHPATAQSTYFINSNNKCEWLKHRGVNQSTAHEFLLTPDTSDSKAPFDRAHIPRPCREQGRAQIVAKSIAKPDRKSVVKGKRLSVRVDLGGGRILKKKTNQNSITNSENLPHTN